MLKPENRSSKKAQDELGFQLFSSSVGQLLNTCMILADAEICRGEGNEPQRIRHVELRT